MVIRWNDLFVFIQYHTDGNLCDCYHKISVSTNSYSQYMVNLKNSKIRKSVQIAKELHNVEVVFKKRMSFAGTFCCDKMRVYICVQDKLLRSGTIDDFMST